MPKIASDAVWRQAEMLMQPAFIRLVANIGKQLEQSPWRGDYQDVQVWPEGVDDRTKATVLELRQQLETATGEAAIAIQQQLDQLPGTYPGYHLCLTHGDQEVRVDIWALCYQVCFRDYDAATGTSRSRGFGQPASSEVEIDSQLLEADGEVDWNQLDAKARQLIDQIFALLPALPGEQAPSGED